jgi:hypothetical protein
MEQNAIHFIQQNGEFTHSELLEYLAPVHGEPLFMAYMCTRNVYGQSYCIITCVQGITNIMHVVYVQRAIMHMPERVQDQHMDTKKYTQYHEEQANSIAIGHYTLT